MCWRNGIIAGPGVRATPPPNWVSHLLRFALHGNRAAKASRQRASGGFGGKRVGAASGGSREEGIQRTLQFLLFVVSTETLARVIRPTDSTHQPGKPIFSGRYHRRFFGARRARGRDQRAIPRQPVFIGRPTYVRPRGCWPRWSQALRIRPLQRGGTTESTTGPLCICDHLPPPIRKATDANS